MEDKLKNVFKVELVLAVAIIQLYLLLAFKISSNVKNGLEASELNLYYPPNTY